MARYSWSVIAAAAAAALPAKAAAQLAGALVLEQPASVEAAGMGGAAFLGTRASAALFEQPAALVGAGGATGSLARYGSEGTLLALSAARTWSGGTLAFGVRALHYATTVLPLARGAVEPLFLGGRRNASETAATVGYGREVLGLDAGLAVSYVEQRFADALAVTVAADLGVRADVGPLEVGLTGRSLGPDPDFAGATSELPYEVVAAASWGQAPVGPLDMLVTTSVTRRRDGEVIPAGGLELSYWPIQGRTFRLRAGLVRPAGDGRRPYTLGAAFTGDDITIEYAFQSFDGPGDIHRFGIRWR